MFVELRLALDDLQNETSQDSGPLVTIFILVIAEVEHRVLVINLRCRCLVLLCQERG